MRTASLFAAQGGQRVRSPAILSHVTGTQELIHAHLPPSREHISAYCGPVEWTPREIKNRRVAKDWDQDRLAKALGVSRRAITNWETGKAEPRGENRRRLDAVLGDTPQPDISLQGATDAQFVAEMARRLAQRTNPAQLPKNDLWWPRNHPQDAEPLADPPGATEAQ